MNQDDYEELEALRGIEADLFHCFRVTHGLDRRRLRNETPEGLWLELALRVNAYEQAFAAPRRRAARERVKRRPGASGESVSRRNKTIAQAAANAASFPEQHRIVACADELMDLLDRLKARVTDG